MYLCLSEKKKYMFCGCLFRRLLHFCHNESSYSYGKGGKGGEKKLFLLIALLLCSFTPDTKEMMQLPASVPVVHQCGGQGESVALITLWKWWKTQVWHGNEGINNDAQCNRMRKKCLLWEKSAETQPCLTTNYNTLKNWYYHDLYTFCFSTPWIL